MPGKKQIGMRAKRSPPDRCYYCGGLLRERPVPYQAMVKSTKDHKIPKSRGGKHGDNIVWACALCNRDKDDMTDDEFIYFCRTGELAPQYVIYLKANTSKNLIKNLGPRRDAINEKWGKQKKPVQQGDMFGGGTELKGADEVDQAFQAYCEAQAQCRLYKAHSIGGERRRKLNARLKQCGGLENWKALMVKAKSSRFLNGHNDSGWIAGLDFFLRPAKLTMLMEGQYDTPGHDPMAAQNEDRYSIAAGLGLGGCSDGAGEAYDTDNRVIEGAEPINPDVGPSDD